MALEEQVAGIGSLVEAKAVSNIVTASERKILAMINATEEALARRVDMIVKLSCRCHRR